MTDQSNNNHLLETLDDNNPIHDLFLKSCQESIIEIFRTFVMTEVSLRTVPGPKLESTEPHNTHFIMSANRLNCMVNISFKGDSLLAVAKRILGEEKQSLPSAIDASKELSNILYGCIKKRLQHDGFSFGLAQYLYSIKTPPEPLLNEEVRYGFDFGVQSDLGVINVRALYDTIEFSSDKNKVVVGKNKDEAKDKSVTRYVEGYQAVKLTDLAIGSEIDFDLFIHFPLNNRIFLYKRGGDSLSESTYNRFKNFKFDYFYLHNEDQSRFVDYMAKQAAAMLSDPKLAVSERSQKAQAIASNLISGYFDDPENRDSYLKLSHEVCQRMLDEMLSDDDPIKNLFSKLTYQMQGIQAHSANVQAMSMVMGLALGYVNPKLLVSLSLGALFHDIGYTQIERSLHHKPESELTEKEKEIIHQHPKVGADIVAGSNADFPYEAILIIMQHHERSDGSGYPRGLKGFQIYELSKVVAIANDFDNAMIIAGEKANPTEIVKKMWLDLNEPKNRKHDLSLFQKIFEKLIPNLPLEISHRK